MVKRWRCVLTGHCVLAVRCVLALCCVLALHCVLALRCVLAVYVVSVVFLALFLVDVVNSWLRIQLFFAILRTVHRCVRGSRYPFKSSVSEDFTLPVAGLNLYS